MDNILSLMIFVAYMLILPSPGVSISLDSISQSQNLSDGNGMTLVSQGGIFEFGFFSPGSSKKRYLGIWYRNISVRTAIWVANRLNPINDTSGVLAVNSTGNLALRQTSTNTVVWYTSSAKQAQNAVAELLDSGNLVVRDEKEANPDAYLWQSFDYPTDTMLPGMKIGWDLRTSFNRHLTAWKSPDDPSPGEFFYGLEINNFYPDTYLRKGNQKYYRSGPWNGLNPSGVPEIRSKPNFYYRQFVTNEVEVYYTETLNNNSLISRVVVNQTGYKFIRYLWSEADKEWKLYTSVPEDTCDTYGLCGVNGNCIATESPVCHCIKGFIPKSPQQWNSFNWSQGCVRHKPLNCTNKQSDGFVKLTSLKVPDTAHTWIDWTISLEECREKCLNNCSCMAYTNPDVRGTGSGCAMWFGDLIDIKKFPAGVGGQDLYIRLDASELEAERGHKKLIIIVVTTIAVILGMLLLGLYYILSVRRNVTELDQNSEGSDEDLDLPLVDLSTIAVATNDFSMGNKIGEGGFGPVYRGRLLDGQEIAVKRLSIDSGQGQIEFKNEVKLIAKLQHRNLVKLLSCCIQGQEKLLVYEYMPNGSLDSFIFDRVKGKLLDWSRRFQIICGIARGLLYLHQDSRLRIIHRDLKASNILLDNELNAKISDFGMAKTFGGDQTEGNTKRIVGTYGYIAPEYAANGLVSVKSDVFSYGVLLLEIVCGKRNRGFNHPNQYINLISHVWSLSQQGKVLELIDKNIVDSCIDSEVQRCIHVGLLCVQQHPEDRPIMPSVILMLGSDTELPKPKQPGFFLSRDSAEPSSSSSQLQSGSVNEITITLLDAR